MFCSSFIRIINNLLPIIITVLANNFYASQELRHAKHWLKHMVNKAFNRAAKKSSETITGVVVQANRITTTVNEPPTRACPGLPATFGPRPMPPLKYSKPLGRRGPPTAVAILPRPSAPPAGAADGPAAAARLPARARPPPPVPAPHCAAGGRAGPALSRRLAPLRLTPLRAAARRPAHGPRHFLFLPTVPPPLSGMDGP